MPHILKRDFFYGAALNALMKLNYDANITLIESEIHHAVFRMRTNKSFEFIAYMKYTECMSKFDEETQEKEWIVSISKEDHARIGKLIQDNGHVFIFLILGNSFENGNVVVLNEGNYKLLADKSSYTVKHRKRAKEFAIVHKTRGKIRELSISTNRIKDAEFFGSPQRESLLYE